MAEQHPITPPPPHLLKKFSAQARDESSKRDGAGYLKTFAKLCIEWANSQATPNSNQIRSPGITPPPELVQKWVAATESNDCIGAFPTNFEQRICTAAAQWGADQELEACCHWLTEGKDTFYSRQLREARRPKKPSLKEQVLSLLDQAIAHGDCLKTSDALPAIRRALEALPDG